MYCMHRLNSHRCDIQIASGTPHLQVRLVCHRVLPALGVQEGGREEGGGLRQGGGRRGGVNGVEGPGEGSAAIQPKEVF